MDPLGDPLTTRPIQTGWEFTMAPYPSGQFGFIDHPDRRSGNGSVGTRNRTRGDGPEPLLTLLPSLAVLSTTLTLLHNMKSYHVSVSLHAMNMCVHQVPNKPKIYCVPLPGSISSLVSHLLVHLVVLYSPHLQDHKLANHDCLSQSCISCQIY